MLLYISCDRNHIPNGVGLGWGCAPQMAKEYFPFRWTQLMELLKRSLCVTFMLILLCISLLLCICTSLSLHPTLCLSSSLSISQPLSLCLLFPPLLSLINWFVTLPSLLFSYLSVIRFYSSFSSVLTWYMFALHSSLTCAHTHCCTHLLLSFCPSYLDLHQSASSNPLPLSPMGALEKKEVTPKTHPP